MKIYTSKYLNSRANFLELLIKNSLQITFMNWTAVKKKEKKSQFNVQNLM